MSLQWHGAPKYLIRHLKLIQHHAARIVSRSPKCDSITPVLITLHWLPIDYRIEYKVLLLAFKSLNGLAPKYISDLLKQYQPPRSLRSSTMNLLVENDTRSVKYGDRAYENCAPKLWNSMPFELRCCTDLDSFKKGLKTYLFKKAFNI